MTGLIGRKLGMTQVFSDQGEVIPVTVIRTGPCQILQVKTIEKDGYTALKLGFDGVAREVRVDKTESFSPGQELKLDIFKPGDKVEVTGISIGKGFAGTVKRHHFNRGPMSHGSKSHRIPGSIGAGTTPGRIEKGTRMAGRMGGDRVTVRNLKVVEINPEKNLLLVKGAVPGADNGLVIIRKK